MSPLGVLWDRCWSLNALLEGVGCCWAGSQHHCKCEHLSLASDLAAVQRVWEAQDCRGGNKSHLTPTIRGSAKEKASGARHCSNMQRVDLIPPAPTLQHCELCGCFSHQAAEIYSCWPGNTAAIVGLPEMLFATAAPACAARLPWQTDITCLMTSKESVITARAEGNGKASGFLFSRQP